jgi:hypothetical protein
MSNGGRLSDSRDIAGDTPTTAVSVQLSAFIGSLSKINRNTFICNELALNGIPSN